MNWNKKGKVYRALDKEVVEKLFIEEGAPVPKGWYVDVKEALAAWKPNKRRMRTIKPRMQ